MLHTNLALNEKGHLTLAGQDAVDLATRYGTPLYILDENRVRENCRTYVENMRRYFGEGSMPLLASKAMSFKGIYRIAAEEGMGTDFVSCGELYTAKVAGFPMEKGFFHGNNKTDADIRFAMDAGLGYFVADNREELEAIEREATARGIRQKILLRLTPGIDPHTLEAINTGRVDSKFGTAIETGQAEEITRFAASLSHVELCGFHCHIGSQIFETDPFFRAAEIMLRFMADMRHRHGIETAALNLGGGFGVRYVESDPHFDIPAAIREIGERIECLTEQLDMPKPVIYMEPGRSIVADAGTTLYTVGSVKTITGYKSYVSVDGGMPDNPRYALYSSDYTVLNASHADETADFRCTVAGRCCESGDLIQEDVLLSKPQRGDILAVLVTGAYNYSMASNYNRIPRPPVVMLRDGESYVAVRRESFEDLVRNDL